MARAYATQLLPDYPQCVLLRKLLHDFVTNNDGATEQEIDAAYELLMKLSTDMRKKDRCS